jgi:hypothetical protein
MKPLQLWPWIALVLLWAAAWAIVTRQALATLFTSCK